MSEEKRDVLKMDYPSNSHKSKEVKKEETREVKKVVVGKVKQRKKPLSRRFWDTFVGEDVDNVASYIIHDVLVPAAKSTVIDMVQGGIEMLLGVEKKGSRMVRDRGRSYVSYDGISRNRDRRDDRREISRRDRARHNFDDIVLDSRGEAEEVISHLVDLIIDYEQATVADLYDLVGITSEYTDKNWGWTDLSSASVSRVRDGYLLNLPKTRQVK